MSTTNVDVLIVGAGPVGLFCAHELARYGLSFKIIDKKEGLSEKSKALGLHIRTLEVFNDTGLLNKFLDKGLKIHGVDFKSNGRIIASAGFKGIKANRDYLLDLPQSETEAIIYNSLKEQNYDVAWQTEFVDFKELEDHVVAKIEAKNIQQEIKAKWIVACDGAHSTLRHLTYNNFIGDEYGQTWWLADLHIEWDRPEDRMTIYLNEFGPMACFPMGKKRYRIVATAPEGVNKAPTLADMKRIFAKRSKDEAKLSNPVWLSKFYIHHRQVEKYKIGRVFFAGDAAHIHSPMGGQGLNTGIQDIYNLIWKLALVQSGKSKHELLDTYHEERHPVGEHVVEMTHQMTKMTTLKNKLLIKLRNQIMQLAFSYPSVVNHMAKQMAELDINYKKSSIVEDHGNTKKLVAGNFLNNFTVVNTADGKKCKLSSIVKGTKHNVFIFGGHGLLSEKTKLIAREFAEEFAEYIDVHFVIKHPDGIVIEGVKIWQDLHGLAHKKLGIEKSPAIFILRPDKYIGFTQKPLDIEIIRNYLEKIFSDL